MIHEADDDERRCLVQISDMLLADEKLASDNRIWDVLARWHLSHDVTLVVTDQIFADDVLPLSDPRQSVPFDIVCVCGGGALRLLLMDDDKEGTCGMT